MLNVKVLTDMSTKQQADGMEFRHFTAISKDNNICCMSKNGPGKADLQQSTVTMNHAATAAISTDVQMISYWRTNGRSVNSAPSGFMKTAAHS